RLPGREPESTVARPPRFRLVLSGQLLDVLGATGAPVRAVRRSSARPLPIPSLFPVMLVHQKSASCELALRPNFQTLGTTQDSTYLPPSAGPVRTFLTTGHLPSGYRRTW